MPACSDNAPEALVMPAALGGPEWREPPGMLGFYVRRVKRYLRAQADAAGSDQNCGSPP